MTEKVGVFCPTLNVYGGGEYVAIALANTLAKSNHKVILFSDREINVKEIKNYFGETLYPSIENIVQPTYFSSRSLADFYHTIIHSCIAKSKCDIFVDAFSNCVFPWTQVSYIHFPHLNRYVFSKQFPYLSSPHITQAGTLPQVILEKNLIDYNKRLILANSYYTAGEIIKYSGKTAKVLYPPFSSTIAEIGKNASKNSQDNLVVTISRFAPHKQLERIPYIAAQTDKNIQFAVIGRLHSQETLSKLQSIIKKLGLTERVKFYPDASSTEKTELLKKAKIYLHTMVGEHFGISIVEAMALGCVPVVHNSGGMTEFVPSEYRYDNLQEAAVKIRYGIGNWSEQEAEKMKQIADRFSTHNFSLKFMELYSKSYD